MRKIVFSKKNIKWLLVVIICLLMVLILSVVRGSFVGTQKVQASAKRWAGKDGGFAMVSVYLGSGSNLSSEMLARLDYYLGEELKSESITTDNENARLYIMASSKAGKGSFYTDRAGTIGLGYTVVGGDFFKFHPFTLVSGSYINNEGIMKNNVVLDEVAAWRLFGAIDVMGMPIYVGNEEFIVAGVVEVDNSFLSKKAGYKSDGGMVYFPAELGEVLGDSEADCVEIVFPNSVSGYAMKHVKNVVGQLGIDESEMSIVENSNRYELLPSIKRIGAFTTRGMGISEIAYPYWENAAIGVENIVDVINVLWLIFLAVPTVIVIVAIIRFHPIWRLELLVKALYEKFRR